MELATPSLRISQELTQVSPTQEELLLQGNPKRALITKTRGSSQFDDLRLPDAPDLFMKIDAHSFTQELNRWEKRDSYRLEMWQKAYGPEEPLDVRFDDKVIGTERFPHGDEFSVTENLENYAKKLLSLYNHIKSGRNIYLPETRWGARNTAHFLRLAQDLIECKATRYDRMWIQAQFDQFKAWGDDPRSSMKKGAIPQPNHLYGEGARERYAAAQEARWEESKYMVIFDETVAATLAWWSKKQKDFAVAKNLITTVRWWVGTPEAELQPQYRRTLCYFMDLEDPWKDED